MGVVELVFFKRNVSDSKSRKNTHRFGLEKKFCTLPSALGIQIQSPRKEATTRLHILVLSIMYTLNNPVIVPVPNNPLQMIHFSKGTSQSRKNTHRLGLEKEFCTNTFCSWDTNTITKKRKKINQPTDYTSWFFQLCTL